jgi:pimeloyl-ACP methyl ester carboxylesterase
MAGGALAAGASALPPPGRLEKTFDGEEIAVERAGSGAGTVVLVHGWCCDMGYWDAQWGPLKDRYRVVRLDLAGFGRSTRGRTDVSMEAFGKDVVAAVGPGRGPVVLVGHSMGGQVILTAAAALKDRLRGLIGVDTMMYLGQPPGGPDTLKAMAPLLAPFEANFPPAVEGFVRGTFFKKTSDPAFVDRVATGMARADEKTGKAALKALVGFDYRPHLGAVQNLPIAALNAPQKDYDLALARKNAPGFTPIEFPGEAHFLHMEVPGAFNQVLSGVIAGMFAR